MQHNFFKPSENIKKKKILILSKEKHMNHCFKLGMNNLQKKKNNGLQKLQHVIGLAKFVVRNPISLCLVHGIQLFTSHVITPTNLKCSTVERNILIRHHPDSL
jgi:hypothetical protein